MFETTRVRSSMVSSTMRMTSCRCMSNRPKGFLGEKGDALALDRVAVQAGFQGVQIFGPAQPDAVYAHQIEQRRSDCAHRHLGRHSFRLVAAVRDQETGWDF